MIENIDFEARVREQKENSIKTIAIPRKTEEKILQNYNLKLKKGKIYDFSIKLEVKEKNEI